MFDGMQAFDRDQVVERFCFGIMMVFSTIGLVLRMFLKKKNMIFRPQEIHWLRHIRNLQKFAFADEDAVAKAYLNY